VVVTLLLALVVMIVYLYSGLMNVAILLLNKH